MAQLTIYTVGHSNHTAEAFLALLRRHDIRTLVDVRSVPHSQFNPQFNQAALKAAVEAGGLQYRYAGEFLGGRPKDPALFKSNGESEQAASEVVDYEAMMRSEPYQRGIKRLLELAAESRVAVMCSEGNPLDCHRHHLIARSLVDPLVKAIGDEITVIHIQRDGVLTTVKPEDFNTQLSLF